MWTCAGVLALAACAVALTRDQFYPYGPGLDLNLPRGSDVASPEIPLKVPVVFYGEIYETVFVNNFGLVTFRSEMPSFLNIEFPLPYPSIAAFYTNIDTTEEGTIYYRETDESHILSKAEDGVQNNFHEYYDFKPTSVFIATWLDVTYGSKNQAKPRNSFQVAIISNGTETFVELLFPEREIQWVQRENLNSLPDANAQSGFVSEDGRIFALRGSGTQKIRNIASWSNTQEPGKYIFRVGNISIEENVALPDQYDQNEVEIEEESKTCAQSGPSVCDIQARCVDYQAGICCQCNEGFYGNGKSCVKDDVPLRVHGKINGALNDVNLDDVDIQAYVVVGEGRAYTALSLVPGDLGSSLQLLNILGSVVGWLFAKPAGSAKNGYQLTGALFNHTADVWFPATGDRISISQEYLGHDVFDQVVMEADIRGSLPVLHAGVKLQTTEYEEQYTIVEPGFIRSESSRTFTNINTGEIYEQRVSQTFKFNECRYAPFTGEKLTPLTLISSRNYLGFEHQDNIVRYGVTNKIVPLGQEDPCIKGRNSCGIHSSCVVQGESFACVCETGFTKIYLEGAEACVDIDECAALTHNCDTNANCYNHDGGFQCRCHPGFIGNGLNCKRLSGCENLTCDINAQCIENAGPNSEAICVCNPGYNGDGLACYQDYETSCASCSPYASCQYSDVHRKYICECGKGFYGDGYSCTQIPPDVQQPDIPDTPRPPPIENNNAGYNDTFVMPHCDSSGCQCPPGYVEFVEEQKNMQICLLNLGNYEEQQNPEPNYSTPSEPNHEPTESYQQFYPSDAPYQPTEWSPYQPTPTPAIPPSPEPYQPPQEQNTDYPPTDNDSLIRCEDDSDCPPNAVCSYLDSTSRWDEKHCVCPEGYEGDAYECIERTSPACSCGVNAHCVSTETNEFICVCEPGYRPVDGYSCIRSLSCNNDSNCEYNAVCRPDPRTGEHVCQCIDGYIKDQSDACIPNTPLCNGATCVDHSSCLYDSEYEVNYCQCDAGYTGNAIVQCVLVEQTCDVTNNCDINAQCTLVDQSYQCICLDGYNGDGYHCQPEYSCRTDSNLCDPHASCLKRDNEYVCECNSGYNGNGSTCKLNPRQAGNFLVASDGASVYRVPFRVTPRDFATPFSSGVSQIAVAVAVDCELGKIYWGDVVSYAIKRASYDGSGYEQFLTLGVKSPEGIAIDWSARNIFWTDSKKLTVEVANIDTKVRKVLFAVNQISNPRGIAVHPQRGKIFWSDWKRSDPKIEWANMDGTQRGVFLDKSDVTLPNSLAIDWQRDRLCYADAGLASIKCVGIDTMEKETIATNCSYPFGLAINGDKFYWTDWKTLKIESIDLQTKLRGQVPIATASRRLYGVAVAPDQCPPLQSICQYRNGGCSTVQLCLPNGQEGRTCVDGDLTLYENA